MNGLLCIDPYSGALLYSRAWVPAFGLLTPSDDPWLDALRLASSVFAWHVNAAAVGSHNVAADGSAAAAAPLSLYAIGEVAIHMHLELQPQLLVLAVTGLRVPHKRGLALAGAVARCYASRAHEHSVFSRSIFSEAMSEALESAVPLTYARACLEAADGARWAWILSLGGMAPTEWASTFEIWERTAGTPWPPEAAAVATPRRRRPPPWRSRSVLNTPSSSVAARVRGPWLAEGVASTLNGKPGDMDSKPGPPELPLPLPTAENIPALLRALANTSPGGHNAPAASCELPLGAAGGRGGVEGRALLLRRGSTLLVLGLTHPHGENGAASPARQGALALAELRTGELLAELDEIFATTLRTQ